MELAYNAYRAETKSKKEFKELSEDEKRAWASVTKTISQLANAELIVKNMITEINQKIEENNKNHA